MTCDQRLRAAVSAYATALVQELHARGWDDAKISVNLHVTHPGFEVVTAGQYVAWDVRRGWHANDGGGTVYARPPLTGPGDPYGVAPHVGDAGGLIAMMIDGRYPWVASTPAAAVDPATLLAHLEAITAPRTTPAPRTGDVDPQREQATPARFVPAVGDLIAALGELAQAARAFEAAVVTDAWSTEHRDAMAARLERARRVVLAYRPVVEAVDEGLAAAARAAFDPPGRPGGA